MNQSSDCDCDCDWERADPDASRPKRSLREGLMVVSGQKKLRT